MSAHNPNIRKKDSVVIARSTQTLIDDRRPLDMIMILDQDASVGGLTPGLVCLMSYDMANS